MRQTREKFMEQPRMQETRRYERFPCAQMVTIRPKGTESTPDDARALVVDVSLGGLKMRTKASLDTTEAYTLTMASGGNPIDFNGSIVHLVPGDESTESSIGFVFRPETHEERVAIANFVHQVFTQAWNAEAA